MMGMMGTHEDVEWLRLKVLLGPPAPALLSRYTQSRVPRPMSRWLLKVSKEGTPQPLGSLCHCSVTAQHRSAAWCSEGTSCVPLCAHCLLSWH